MVIKLSSETPPWFCYIGASFSMSKRRRGNGPGLGGLEFTGHLWEQDSDVTVDNKAAELYPVSSHV